MAKIKNYWSIVLIIALTPLLFWAAIQILPTFDDWTGTTSPSFEPLFRKENFFFYGYHWRPFDCIAGYISGLNPQLLYPAFNHCCVVLGHLLCALAVFFLTGTLGFGRRARNIATAFFFIVPATMATVLSVDGFNQEYALFFDIMAFLAYLKGKYIRWILLIFLATLFKENGLMWAFISPVLAYGFDRIDRKTLRRDLLIGIGIALCYAIAIYVQPKEMYIHEEYVPSVMNVIKSFVKFLFTSFITVDYIYLLHIPSRNLLLALLSWLPTLPLLYIILRQKGMWREKRTWCIIISLLISAAPHIFTVYSMMHAYGGLVFVTLLLCNAQSIEERGERREEREMLCGSKFFTFHFSLFLLTSLAIDTHLWHASVESGLLGKEMAVQAVKKTGKPVKDVFLIIIDEEYPKTSSFCVTPYEAFGWGLAAIHETNYKWPEMISDTLLERSENAPAQALKLGKEKLKEHDCVWIVDHKLIKVIKK